MLHIRIHPELRRRVYAAARQRDVTATREINERLARSFDRDPIVGLAADLKKFMAANKSL